MVIMTLHYELTKRYHRGKTITKCCHTDCDMYKIQGKWIYHTGVPRDYNNISHGYCPQHFQKALELVNLVSRATDSMVYDDCIDGVVQE